MLEYELFHERIRWNNLSENNNVLYVSTERFHFLLVSLCSLSRFSFLFYTEPTQRAKALSIEQGSFLYLGMVSPLILLFLSTGYAFDSAPTSKNKTASTGTLDYAARISTRGRWIVLLE